MLRPPIQLLSQVIDIVPLEKLSRHSRNDGFKFRHL
jgi:hypothetical protein